MVRSSYAARKKTFLHLPFCAAQSSVTLNFTRVVPGGNSRRSYTCGDNARTNQCTPSLYEVCISPNSRPVRRARELLLSNVETAIRGKRFCGCIRQSSQQTIVDKENERARARARARGRERETRKKRTGFCNICNVFRVAEIPEQRAPQGA